MKIYRVVNNEQERNELQIVLNQITLWAECSQLKVQPKKCNILHLGKKNHKFDYFFSDVPLTKTEIVKDLGVLMSPDLNFEAHIRKITRSATNASNLIMRTFKNKNHKFLMKLFNAFVRPKIEYASQIWNPYTKKLIDVLEQIQRRFTKRIPFISELPYLDRLVFLNQITLEERRLHLDLVFLYKIIYHKFDFPFQDHFRYRHNLTRGHSKMLAGSMPAPKLNVFKFSFSQRIVNIWNKLNEEIIGAVNVPHFKILLKSNSNLLQPNLRGSAPRRSVN